MIIGKEQRKSDVLDNPFGGTGRLVLDHLLKPPYCANTMEMFSVAVLEPGSEIGYHMHSGESEGYYIISGRGQYNDNGYVKYVNPGDSTFTPNGHSHSLKNISDENLVFIALIIKE